MSEPSKVDFVLSSISEDSKWLQNRARASRELGINDSAVRFRDLGTLRYWFRMIEANAPWVRTIHLVTETSLPTWLRRDHPKLNVVDGWSLNPSGVRTFNSHAIEACMPLIPGLAEHFVYFNDDFFLSRPVGPEFYFRDGLPYAVPYPTILALGDIHAHAMLNSTGAINRHFSKGEFMRSRRSHLSVRMLDRNIVREPLLRAASAIPPLLDPHLPTPLLKASVADAWSAEPKLIADTQKSVFRSASDVAPIYFAMFWHVATGRFRGVAKSELGEFCDLAEATPDSLESFLRHHRGAQFCINDNECDDFDGIRCRIECVLNERFPKASSFESDC